MMKNIFLFFLFLGGICLLWQGSAWSQPVSSYSLVLEDISPEYNVERLTRQVALNHFGTYLFSRPYSASLCFHQISEDNWRLLMFIVDPNWNRIVYADRKDIWVRSYGSYSGEFYFDFPHGIASDNRGNVYIADTNGDRVVKLKYNFNTDRLSHISTFSTGLNYPYDVDIDNRGTPSDVSDDLIWVANTGNNNIAVFNVNGDLLGTYGTQGPGQGQFSAPLAIAVGKNTYYSNPNIYIADTGNNRVVRLHYNDDPLSLDWMATYQMDAGSYITAVTTDPLNQVWVTDNVNCRIVKFSQYLDYLTTFGSKGTGRTQVLYPTDFMTARGYGDGFLAETWGDHSGGRWYKIGADVLDFKATPNHKDREALIEFYLTESSHTWVNIYDAETDEKVVTLVDDGYYNPGHRSLFWDGKYENGSKVPPGRYRVWIKAKVFYGNYYSIRNANFTFYLLAPPENISFDASDLDVTISWSPIIGATGYKVYYQNRGSTGPPYDGNIIIGRPSPIDVKSDITFTFHKPAQYSNFHVVVTAYTAGGYESGLSEEISFAEGLNLTDHVVISEICYDTYGRDTRCFVELYNPTDSPVNINGWKLVGLNGSNGQEYNSITLSGTINSHGYFLIGQTSSIYWVTPDLVNSKVNYQNGPDGVILKDASGQKVDYIGYGDNPNVNLEGQAFEDVPAGHSIERKPGYMNPLLGNWVDTDNNQADLLDRPTVEPQNSQSMGEPYSPPTDGVLISELYYDDIGADENCFVELYNQTDQDVNVSRWKLVGLDGEDGSEYNFIVFPSNTSIPSHGFFLVGQKEWLYIPHNHTSTFSDLSTTKANYSNYDGAVILKNNCNSVIDFVGYGDSSSYNLVEGPPCHDLWYGFSLERKPGQYNRSGGNWMDTNNNRRDFIPGLPFPQNSSYYREQPSGFIPGPLISEISYDPDWGPDWDCFIELYNPSDTDIDLWGWTVILQNGYGNPKAYNSDTLAKRVYYARIPLEGIIPANGFFLIGQDSPLFGDVIPDIVCGIDLQNGPDAVVLRDNDYNIIDFVAYEPYEPEYPDSLIGKRFDCWLEGHPAAYGRSIERRPGWLNYSGGNGQDTDDNFVDFLARYSPEPQNTASPREYPFLPKVSRELDSRPQEFCLSQNYPNPFNIETTIEYDLPEETWVRITIFNIYGQKVRRLVDGIKDAGYYSVYWDGTNQNSEVVASGIYFYRIVAGRFINTKKMLLLK